MKALITNYTFDKTAGTVRFNGYQSISLDGVLLITNVTSNTIIYNFADPTAGGSVAGNTLTLTADTSAMADSDNLQIFYDDGSTVQNTELTNALRLILVALQNPPNIDRSQNRTRQMTTIESGTITTVTNLTNQANFGSLPADNYYRSLSLNTWANSVRRTIS